MLFHLSLGSIIFGDINISNNSVIASEYHLLMDSSHVLIISLGDSITNSCFDQVFTKNIEISDISLYNKV